MEGVGGEAADVDVDSCVATPNAVLGKRVRASAPCALGRPTISPHVITCEGGCPFAPPWQQLTGFC